MKEGCDVGGGDGVRDGGVTWKRRMRRRRRVVTRSNAVLTKKREGGGGGENGLKMERHSTKRARFRMTTRRDVMGGL